METLSVSGTRPRWLERPPSRGTNGLLQPPAPSPAPSCRGSSQSRAGGASLLGALLRGDRRERFSTWELRTHGPESSLPSLQAPPSPPLPGIACGSRSANPDCWATVRVEGDAVERAWVLHQGTNGLFWTSMALQTHSRNALGTDGEPGDTVPSTVLWFCWEGTTLGRTTAKPFICLGTHEVSRRAAPKGLGINLEIFPKDPASCLFFEAHVTLGPEARLPGRGAGADAVSGPHSTRSSPGCRGGACPPVPTPPLPTWAGGYTCGSPAPVPVTVGRKRDFSRRCPLRWPLVPRLRFYIALGRSPRAAPQECRSPSQAIFGCRALEPPPPTSSRPGSPPGSPALTKEGEVWPEPR